MQVNNTSLLGATHVDAVRALRTAGDNLSLIVCDGYDEAEAMELNQENVLYNPSLVEPLRFSPDSQSSATSGDSFLVSVYLILPELTFVNEISLTKEVLFFRAPSYETYIFKQY